MMAAIDDGYLVGKATRVFGKCIYIFLNVIIGGCVYSTMYNLLNYPAGVLPVTKVTEQDIKDMANYPNKTKFEKNIKKVKSMKRFRSI